MIGKIVSSEMPRTRRFGKLGLARRERPSLLKKREMQLPAKKEVKPNVHENTKRDKMLASSSDNCGFYGDGNDPCAPLFP